MKLKRIFALVFSIIVLSACSDVNNDNSIKGSGNLITETREVSSFNKIQLSGSGNLILQQGDNERLEIETDDNLMEHITARVRNNTLYLEPEQNTAISPSRLTYRVNLIDVSRITVSGSANVTTEQLDTSDLWLNIQGSGKVEIGELNADSTHIDVTGSGRIKLAGTAAEVDLDLSGSGNILFEELECNHARVDITGSGRATMWVTGTLNGTISGSGIVNYYGRPVTEFNITGSGSVKDLGGK